MCVINGVIVSKSEYIRIRQIAKQLQAMVPKLTIRKGYDYGDWPIIKPIMGEPKDIEIAMARWGFLPDTVHKQADIRAFQEAIFSINAQGENLFISESGKASMWRTAARKHRCLVLSSGFIEHRHIFLPNKKRGELRKTAETYPYWITLPDREYFFMTGVYNHWLDQASDYGKDSFAITTAPANTLMEQIHNTKKRMPTILTEDLAYRWLFEDLTDKQIQEIAGYQYPSSQMKAWPIHRSWWKQIDPIKPVHYSELDDFPIIVEAA